MPPSSRHRALALGIAIGVSLGALGGGASGRTLVPEAPPQFFGLSPQTALDSADLTLIAKADVDTIRLPLAWSAVEIANPRDSAPDWSRFDRLVTTSAKQLVRVVPFVYSTPVWLAETPTTEPTSPALRHYWHGFLRRAVRRYGPGGEFWSENPDLTEQPIRTWQIWNEPNIVTFSQNPDPRRYGRLLRSSSRVIRRMDPGARILMAGLFGRPLEVPPNISPAQFLEGALRVEGVEGALDAVSLHPYVASARAIPSKIRAIRDVLRRAGIPRTPLWITELGWGSDLFESRWEKGLLGQASELDASFSLLAGNRSRWNIGRVYWFSNIDVPHACRFCDSAGLLTSDFEPKPSWYAFNRWTGGDASAVKAFRMAKTAP